MEAKRAETTAAERTTTELRETEEAGRGERGPESWRRGGGGTIWAFSTLSGGLMDFLEEEEM